MNDIRQSKQYAEYMARTGWEVEDVSGFYAFIKKFPVIGSFIKIQRPESLDFKAIDYLSRQYRTFQVVMEPKEKKQALHLKRLRFKKSKSPYLPSKTLLLDLTQDIDSLYSGLKKDAKQSLKKTKGIRVYAVEDTNAFHTTWKKAVPRTRFVYSKDKLKTMKYTFKEDITFLTTPSGSAGAIFIKTKDVAYYWQAFTNQKGREELSQYKIVWTGINWAKEEGAKIFDFEGIYDKRFPNDSWKGFSLFKKKFGGKVKKYPGAFTRLSFPI